MLSLIARFTFSLKHEVTCTYVQYEYRTILLLAFKAASCIMFIAFAVHVTVMMKLAFKASPSNNDYTEKAAMPLSSHAFVNLHPQMK